MSVQPLGYSTLPPAKRPSRGLALGRWFVSVVFWPTLALIVMGGSYAAGSAALGPIVGVAASTLMALLLVAGATLARGARRVSGSSVLLYLDQAVRTDLPLSAMIAAAERSERGALRGRLGKLRRRLEAGAAISTATSSAAPSLPRHVQATLRAGESVGRLASALRRVTVNRRLFPAFNATEAIYLRWYPLVMGVIGFLILQVLLIYVLPKQQQWARYLGAPPPVIQRWSMSDAMSVSLGMLIFIGATLLLGRMLSQLFVARGLSAGPLRPLLDIVSWRLPIAGAPMRHKALAFACFSLGESIEAGLPPERALIATADACGNFVLKRRLRRWARRLHAEKPFAAAAAEAHFPRLMCGLLATGDSPGDWQEALRFLCRHYDTRHTRAAALLRGAVVPGIAIGFGGLALAMALGVFQPLVNAMYILLAHRP